MLLLNREISVQSHNIDLSNAAICSLACAFMKKEVT